MSTSFLNSKLDNERTMRKRSIIKEQVVKRPTSDTKPQPESSKGKVS